MEELFENFSHELTAEQELREEIRLICRELEQKSRAISKVLQKFHTSTGVDRLSLVEKVAEMFRDIPDLYGSLSKKIGDGEYYKFHDHFRFVTQRLSFLAAFVVFMKYLGTDQQLANPDSVAQMLGISSKYSPSGFHLDLDDYLSGILLLADELSRLAVNSVTSQDYSLPLIIRDFLSDIDAGFRMLNLKNDHLRKRFDGLKYHVQRVEGVTYDMSIRKLAPLDKSASNTE